MTNTHDVNKPQSDDPAVEYREIPVEDASDSTQIVHALMDVIEQEGLVLDRDELTSRGFSWLRDASGQKNSLILLDGFSVATVPVGGGEPVHAPGSQPVLLARTEGRVEMDDAASHIDTAAQKRGSCLVMRSQDAKLALVIGERDGASLCLPVDFLVYEGVVVAVADGDVFATRTDYEAAAQKAQDSLADPS